LILLNLDGDSTLSGISRMTNDEIVFVMDAMPTDSAAFQLGFWLSRNPQRLIPILNKSAYQDGNLPRWAKIAENEAIRLRPEIMGIFGMSWQEKIVAFMKKQLKGQTELLKKLSTWWGENTTLIDNLYREYTALIATGGNPVSFSELPGIDGSGGTFSVETELTATNIAAKTAIDRKIVESFLRALFVLARDGKIDYKKLDPVGYIETKTATKSVTAEKTGILEQVSSSAKTILWVAGLGTALYLLNTLKGLSK
jgi:hypothetical protein